MKYSYSPMLDYIIKNMKNNLDTEVKMRPHLSLVPKDQEKDLMPLIQKIGRWIVFTVYDDFQKPREIAWILDKVESNWFSVITFNEAIRIGERIAIGWWMSISTEWCSIRYPYIFNGHPIEIKLYWKDLIFRGVRYAVKQWVEDSLIDEKSQEL